MYKESCVKGSPGSKIFYTPYSTYISITQYNEVALVLCEATMASIVADSEAVKAKINLTIFWVQQSDIVW